MCEAEVFGCLAQSDESTHAAYPVTEREQQLTEESDTRATGTRTSIQYTIYKINVYGKAYIYIIRTNLNVLKDSRKRHLRKLYTFDT